MKTEEEIEYLRSKIAVLEKEDREEWVKLKNKLRNSREAVCETHGGHFYTEPMDRIERMVMGYREVTYRVCRVCRKEEILKDEYFE